ncbi:hypothetical protein C8J57DRAFT_1500848 [Mycena rebaudengoi]|nr:hypothetical protein C8J57DRAFT_1500848 [Mycena rebaudengoi]
MFQPSIASVNLAGVLLMTLFYGMYFILFVASIYLLFRHTKGKYTHLMKSTVFLFAIGIFIAVTGVRAIIQVSDCDLYLIESVTQDWVITLCRTFEGFIYFQDGLGANTYFSSDAQVLGTVGDVFVALSFLLADSMIIYRLWVVWSYNKLVVIVPIMGLMGLMGSLIGITVVIKENIPVSQNLAIIPTIVFSIVTNVYCSAFITWRIWEITRRAAPIGGTNLRHFVAVVVESAAIYTSWMIYFSVTHQLNSNLQIISLACIPPVGAITNALIHLRFALGETVEQQGAKSSVLSGPIQFVPLCSGGQNRDREAELESTSKTGVA